MKKKARDPENREYKFWSTQPVPQYKEGNDDKPVGPIDEEKTVADIRDEPLNLPSAFEWTTVDVQDTKEMDELYNLLYENYVEDDENTFRFNYKPAFLTWALTPPGWRRDWHLAVRVKTSKKLVGFISAIPADIRIHDKTVSMVEINFLCVIKKLRTKRLAPVLIQEITRRVNKQGIFQAAYTSGTVLPKPTAKCRYHHRTLNAKKLTEVKFTRIGSHGTLQKMMKHYQLPREPQTRGFRPLTKADCEEAFGKLTKYLEQFQIANVFRSVEEFEHWFLPRDSVVSAYVVENPETKELTDFVSFYCIPSSVLKHPVHKEIKAAFMYYSYHTKTDYQQLMTDALICAKKESYDVFNALDNQNHLDFLQPLKFGEGDGSLNYYFYNYRFPEVNCSQEGLILL